MKTFLNFFRQLDEIKLHDARLEERVHMGSQDIAQWTKAIPKEEKAF
jgi:hypothetical protein